MLSWNLKILLVIPPDIIKVFLLQGRKFVLPPATIIKMNIPNGKKRQRKKEYNADNGEG